MSSRDPNPLWRVRIDLPAWEEDLAASSPSARRHAERWRLRIEATGGIPHRELRRTRAQDDGGLDLPNCAKTRIPDPTSDDPQRSPWGAVLLFERERAAGQLVLVFLAFGLRHPRPETRQASLYERAHRRLQNTP